MGLSKKNFSPSPDWMRHAQLTFTLGGAKLNLPFDIDLQDKDEKNIFYEMTRFIIVIDEISVDNRKTKSIC